jgi:hypothetical protein
VYVPAGNNSSVLPPIIVSSLSPFLTLEQQIQIANLHLRILLAFAVSKDCDAAQDMFRENQVVHILTQEIDLEHTRVIYEADLVCFLMI